MIRYTKGNRARDIAGVIFLALASTLLWVEHAMADRPSENFLSSDDVVQEAIRTSSRSSPVHG